jgi:protein-S-isoprenylcysteine O-methyltransferase Ste14
MNEQKAPWFFRKRASLFGMIYGVAFFFGFFIAGLMGTPTRSFYLTSGHVEIFAGLVLLFTFGGYALRVWASSYLAASIVWQQDVQLGELRQSGPYRFVRNPLYVGNFLQAIGMGLLGTWQVLAILLIAMSIYQAAIVSVEEKFLTAERGDQYKRYLAAVPRFIPLPWKVAPDGGQHGSLRDGVRSELMTSGFAVASLIIIAITWPR